MIFFQICKLVFFHFFPDGCFTFNFKTIKTNRAKTVMLLTVREQQLGHFEPPYISTVSQDFKNEENTESQQVLPHHVRKKLNYFVQY